MINRELKFKELLSNEDYEEALSNASLSSLGAWYAELLNKNLFEISNFDIIRCIRQNVFVDEVVYESLQRMMESGTALYSEDDCVELMSKIASVKREVLLPYRDNIEKIIENMRKENSIEKYKMWMYEDEKEEFKGSISKLRQKLEVSEN